MKRLRLFFLSCMTVIILQSSTTNGAVWQNIIDAHITLCHNPEHTQLVHVLRAIYLCTSFRKRYIETSMTYSSGNVIIMEKWKYFISYIHYSSPIEIALDVRLSMLYPKGLGFNISFVQFETGFQAQCVLMKD